MAIGDAVALFMGTATTVYQPSAGVEVKITVIGKPGATDVVELYDGSNVNNFIHASATTHEDHVNGASRVVNDYNIALMLTNDIYIRKGGTSERCYIGGVQTNA